MDCSNFFYIIRTLDKDIRYSFFYYRYDVGIDSNAGE